MIGHFDSEAREEPSQVTQVGCALVCSVFGTQSECRLCSVERQLAGITNLSALVRLAAQACFRKLNAIAAQVFGCI